jgi:hypothetical protein
MPVCSRAGRPDFLPRSMVCGLTKPRLTDSKPSRRANGFYTKIRLAGISAALVVQGAC